MVNKDEYCHYDECSSNNVFRHHWLVPIASATSRVRDNSLNGAL